MEAKVLFFFLAALVPLVTGFVWYHPKLFGTAWQKGTGLSPDVFKRGPKPLVFVVSYVLSVFLAAGLYGVVVHQIGVESLFATREGFGDPSSPLHQQYEAMMDAVKDVHRSFGHGAFHGALAGVFIALPILATNGMFARRAWRHNAINAGYWIVTLALMGGILCGYV